MRRWLLLSTLLLLFFTLLLVGFGSWLLRSNAGAVWLLDVVSATSDIQISVRQLDGQLADQLILHELTVIFPDGKVTAGRVHLDWQPLSAMHQNLRVNVLEIEKLVLWSPSSDQSVEPRMAQEEGQLFSAGDLAFLPAWLTIEVVRLELKEFTSRDEAGVAVIADEVSGHYLWSRQQIKAPDFVYLSPYVHLRGALDWDLQHPHLQMSAEVQLPETLVSSESFHDIAVPVSFPGEIAFDGDWNNFSGSVSFGLEGGPKDVVWLAAEAQGSWRGIRFDALQGRYLAGRLTGDLELAWIDSFSMHGQLSAVGLNTGGLLDDLNGQASLEVTGGLLVPYDDQPLQSTIEARIHKAQVRGQEVAGSLFANWQKGSLNELNLDLSSSAASVVASGRPAERLELKVDVTDLNPFHPELSGGLKISGWLRWSDDYLTGDITGSGAELGWQDYSLARLSFQGRHLARETPLQFEIVGRTLQHAGIRLDRLQLGAKGSLEIHDLTMVMEGPAAGFETELTARYLDKSWQADILSFAGRTSKLGVWNLESPASLSWYEQALSLESFALSSHRGERLTLELRRWPAATDSRMSIGWHELHHEWLAYFLPEQDVSGKSSGELMLKIKDSQPVSMQAKLTASAELLDEFAEVTLPSLRAEAHWQEDGLKLDVNAENATGGALEVIARSNQPLSWQWPPEELSLQMQWRSVKLTAIKQFREPWAEQGVSTGKAQLEIVGGELLRASANAAVDGFAPQVAQSPGLRALTADLQWDERSFDCSALVEDTRGGSLTLRLKSTDAPRLPWPESGHAELEFSNLNLQAISSLLPDEFDFDGLIHGHSSGSWQKGGRFSLQGRASLSESELLWHSAEGQVDTLVEQADIEWQWQGESLSGSLVSQLAKDGELRGRWQLPLPARWPVVFYAAGPVQAELQGKMQATGLLVALAPGLVQDLRGQIETDLTVAGTWEAPLVSGRLALIDASVYLPSTGVTVEDIMLNTVFRDEQLKIEEFSLRSGPGSLSGAGELNFELWRLKNFRMDINGERLQIFNFPELQVLCSPDLQLSGDLEKVRLKGNLLIPEMTLLGSTIAPEALPSNDVVIFSSEKNEQPALPFDADIQIVVELGDEVVVKTAGLETKLAGGGNVTLDQHGHLATWGEISLTEGIYKAYGANLDIKQGILKYSGGSILNPELRIFAARDIGTVQAGVQITGTAEVPVVSLYSNPAMPERDIIAYIFMGRPMRVGQEGEDALMIGAGALIPNYGETFSDLGISEIDIQGLFSGAGGVRLRKRLTERLELESTLGIESGIDLYYIFEFD